MTRVHEFSVFDLQPDLLSGLEMALAIAMPFVDENFLFLANGYVVADRLAQNFGCLDVAWQGCLLYADLDNPYEAIPQLQALHHLPDRVERYPIVCPAVLPVNVMPCR